jgi:hypothetical protein
MLGKGMTPYRPSGVVPGIIAELDGLARAPTNGNGRHAQPPTREIDRSLIVGGRQ